MKDPAARMAEAMKAGVPTFKMFTAYGARGLMSGDAALFSALKAARGLGALICVHAENGPVIDLLTETYAAKGGIKALPICPARLLPRQRLSAASPYWRLPPVLLSISCTCPPPAPRL